MYSKASILDASGLYTRIGLKEPTKTGYTGKLDTTSKTTKSGFYYDKYHTLANFINIYDCQDDPEITNAEINTAIIDWRKEAIEYGLSLVFQGQPDLIQSEMQFKNANDFNYLIENTGKFVGYEITVPDDDRILNVLNNIVMQFDGAATFNLYLYHSSKKTAISTTSITTTADDFDLTSLSISLYAKSSTYSSGKFYLGYYQDDLGTVKAYDRQYDVSSQQTVFNGIGLRSFMVEPNGTNLFDIAAIEYTSESWGMNLNISTFHDYTNLILNNQEMFDDIQGLAFAIRVLEMIKTTGRINPTQRVNENLPSIALFDLEDQPGDNGAPKSIGLKTRLRIEVERVRKSLFESYKILSYTPK